MYGGKYDWERGFNFRSTAAYVGDKAGETYEIASTAYPQTRNGVRFGWASTGGVGTRDRSTAVDRRLAGMDFNDGGQAFRVDLPGPGLYHFRLALGDDGSGQTRQYMQVKDTASGVVFVTLDPGNNAGGDFFDAWGHLYTAAEWPAKNQPRPIWSRGKSISFCLGTTGSSDASVAHIWIGRVARSRTWLYGALSSGGGGGLTLYGGAALLPAC